ncbi:ABC transporter permease [bacterium]|nr:ABC transporter permease [bacterium]
MRDLLRQLFRHGSGFVGLVIVFVAVVAGLFCGTLSPFSPTYQYRGQEKLPPGSAITADEARQASYADNGQRSSGTFIWGTDSSGRDVYSRVLHGARISLLVGVVATIINVLIGLLIGTVSGYFGGWTDTLLMRLTDTFFAFPGVLLAIIILATLNNDEVKSVLGSISGSIDPGIWGLFIALGLTGWTGIARVIRGTVISLREKEFIEAARAVGCSNSRIILLHIIPNCMAPLTVLATMQVAYNILSEAGLSFLGLGIQPPNASWGGMLSTAKNYFYDMPWWGIFPGLALALTVLGFNLLGDGLRDILDPRMKVRT